VLDGLYKTVDDLNYEKKENKYGDILYIKRIKTINNLKIQNRNEQKLKQL
jgi:hypothetical protein